MQGFVADQKVYEHEHEFFQNSGKIENLSTNAATQRKNRRAKAASRTKQAKCAFDSGLYFTDLT